MKDCFAATHFIYLLNNFAFFAMYFIINIPCHKSIFFQYNKIRGKEFFQNQNKKNRTHENFKMLGKLFFDRFICN
jgi:hypothetical protein